MNTGDMQTPPRRIPRTPPDRQREIIRENIKTLERLGDTYAANRQRELLAWLEAEEKGSKK